MANRKMKKERSHMGGKKPFTMGPKKPEPDDRPRPPMSKQKRKKLGGMSI